MRRGRKYGKKRYDLQGGGYVGSETKLPPLIEATKQAQNLMKIVNALPDEETKQLAMDLYKKMGDRE